ncbi:Bug family tripartite tricarboxylate transporter substrate binding protein [Ramlibacter rhizophilus]|uniref:Tripartite tricarboxylate transporter substrate binding protein n=1 Tax=Ramlibacter rhizophilus TaxID=1781167 RepID=A0A4Z0BHU3_9BURK|nr:tripartite tricarboxylate transporter substrate binding protein [Ramlibacter rhizophilus]TFY98033.1 tripartite tricarboxylate transporter substrate binding protein [Ramlibacter rhizophilus]
MKSRTFLKACAAGVLAVAAPLGIAQAWPAKPVTVIVPFAPGGGVDSTARLVMSKLAEQIKQPVVIENVPGASGTIGTTRAAKAPADGHTLLFAVASPLNVAPLVQPAAVRYDTFKDFTPLATVAVGPFVLVARRELPVASTAELLKLARSQPGKLTVGTDGVGTSLHVTSELIQQRAGIKLLHVPYKSGPQVLTDVGGGQVDLAVLPLTLAQPFIRDGKVRALGVTSAARWPGMPEVPALAETADLREVNVESWLGLLGPAQLPPATASAIVAAVQATMKDPDVVRKLAEIANRPMVLEQKAFADYLLRERQMLQEVVTRAQIKVE